MANDYFDDDDWDELARLTLARAEDVNDIASAVVVGFDRLPAELHLKQGRVTFIASDTGTLNTHILTPTHLPAAYADGMTYTFRASTTNTGAATVDIYGTGSVLLGVKSIRNYAGAALTGGEIVSGAFTTIRYDATNGYWRIRSPLTTVASVTTFNIDALAAGAEVDPLNDYVPIYDASAGAQRKVPTGLIADEYSIILKGQLFAGA